MAEMKINFISLLLIIYLKYQC